MSLITRFKRWVLTWALTVAFTFPKQHYPRQIIAFLSFFFRKRSSWIHKVDGYGYWVAEDLKGAKREAISDRISESDVVLLWVPGGGFRFDLGKLYTPTFATWIRALQADRNIKSMVFVADYHLGPEQLFPTAMKDVARTYDWLVDTMHISPQKIIIGGDDAGVAILLDTLFHKIPSDKRPAGMICASPYTGLEAGGPSWHANLGADILTEKSIERMEESYMGPEDAEYEDDIPPFRYLRQTNELASFIPRRLLVLLGGKEVLLEEGGILASRATGSGVQTMVVQEPTGVHLWFMFLDILVEDSSSRQAMMDRFVEFVYGTIKR
ncbi:Carboxylesterase LipF [Choanephora cucurbitarum]|uniref:Carboxylesterase LipF n=1 Tax=Choanephora cucurbitarum TaxID=101091 RepID=A0A1C7N5D3_9FUNG|nr:Carboxylesterase LipF [Choanephora cucurbitarum]